MTHERIRLLRPEWYATLSCVTCLLARCCCVHFLKGHRRPSPAERRRRCQESVGWHRLRCRALRTKGNAGCGCDCDCGHHGCCLSHDPRARVAFAATCHQEISGQAQPPRAQRQALLRATTIRTHACISYTKKAACTWFARPRSQQVTQPASQLVEAYIKSNKLPSFSGWCLGAQRLFNSRQQRHTFLLESV